MVVVDSSVWIANLRGVETEAVDRLRKIVGEGSAVVGDLILLEVLQGARDEAHAARIERDLRQFPVLPMQGGALAVKAARNYRILREGGITIRKAIDLVIGTFCIETGFALLQHDRDFRGMASRLGLQLA